MTEQEQLFFSSDPSSESLSLETYGAETPSLETASLPPTHSVFSESTEPTPEAEAHGEALLEQLSLENIQSEFAVRERFGAQTWGKIKGLGENSLRKLETSGEKALNWAEERGIPLPHSKLGNALAAGGLAIVGFTPGAGALWAVAYIFAKRAREVDRLQHSAMST